MSLLIINGSPRNKKSNSKILADKFLEGFASVSQEPFEVFYLASASSRQALMTAFESVDTVIIIFPLYTDSMPAIVKTFLKSSFITGQLAQKQWVLLFSQDLQNPYIQLLWRPGLRNIAAEWVSIIWER